jgi:hypothetical protein
MQRVFPDTPIHRYPDTPTPRYTDTAAERDDLCQHRGRLRKPAMFDQIISLCCTAKRIKAYVPVRLSFLQM